MLFNSTLHGACIAPFYDASMFPEGGCMFLHISNLSQHKEEEKRTNAETVVDGRLCARQAQTIDSPLCCLPCPYTYWTYPESFSKVNTVAAWLNVVGMILQLFMLISYTVLPTAKTRSHYLTLCLVVAVIFVNLGFVIPLAAQPIQCYNEITPNDMYSSMTCAWSGAFLLAGALAGTIWIFIRAVSMHLQICWDISPGARFFYVSQAAGWGVTAILFTVAISVTGVSFRLGSVCHINHENSMVTLWGWLLAVSGAAIIAQLSTFGYCINVYLKSLWEDTSRPSSRCSEGSLPTSDCSNHPRHALEIYRRLKSVLYLQWRSCLIVVVLLTDVIFFVVVFVYLDKLEVSILHDYKHLYPWAECLMSNPGDRYRCFPLSRHWLISETTVGTVLIMFSLLGIELFILLFRWSLLSGWRDLWIRRSASEFVSLDARAVSRGTPSPAFELHTPDHHFRFEFDSKSVDPSAATETDSSRASASLPPPDPAPQSPAVAVYSPRRLEDDAAGWGPPSHQTRQVSAQRRCVVAAPTARLRVLTEWDPASTFAKGEAARSSVKSEVTPGQAL